MDWISIIMTLLGGTSALGVVSAIAYRKENKKLKRLEVKMSHIQAQKEEMDLADMYKDKVVGLVALMEQVSAKQDSGGEKQDQIIKHLGDLDKRVSDMDGRVTDIANYLNGDFKTYVQRLHAGDKPKRNRKQAAAAAE